jgi:hypothetical protein
MITRRKTLLGSVAVAALLLGGSLTANAWLHPGSSGGVPGWRTLPVGAGGLITGMYIAPNGTIICRSDVGGLYRWTGTTSTLTNPNDKWLQLMNNASLPAGGVGGSTGAYEHVLAPGNTDKHYAIMGGASGYWVSYSTDQGLHWTHSNLNFSNADSNGNERRQYYKIIVDPSNDNVVYVGLPKSNGVSFGVWTTLGAAAGGTTDGHTFASIAALGQCTVGCCAGLVIDPTQGTTTVAGQTVTKRIIIPVGGVGIFESTNGGASFTEIAVASIGSFANKHVWNGVLNRNGVYYANVVNGDGFGATGSLWRYASGVWTNLGTSMGSGTNINSTMFVDPRVGHEGFLGVPTNGFGIGQSSNNADTGSPPTWTGTSFGNITVAKGASYDIPYMNFIFGQGTNVFVDNTMSIIDGNGVQYWCGGQSIWYLDSIVTYPTFGGQTITSNSFGRGQEATVAQDVLCPPGSTFPIVAPQDLGLPLRGSFTAYPVETFPHFAEYLAMNLEYAASDPSIVVARVTAQQNSTVDASGISTDFGANFTAFTTQPNWQGVVVGSASGTVLTVTSVTSGSVAIGQWVNGDPSVTIASFGTGTGGAGTYNLANSVTIAGGSTINLVVPIQGGNAVAVDLNHIMMCGTGFGSSSVMVPQYTTNGGAVWQRNNLPPRHWPMRSWFFGGSPRPFAVGYGTDLGKVWAADCTNNQAAVYKSVDNGANFGNNSPNFDNGSPIWSSAGPFIALNLPYLHTVPGFPGHLWLVGSHSGGSVVFQVSKDDGVTWSGAGAFPSISGQTLFWPDIFTMGAPASPGGYPTLYCRFQAFGLSGFYEGQYNGTTITWTLFGPTGNLNADMPVSCQVSGINAVRGDFNLYRRLFAVTGSMGYAYYHP